jgi:hypothetical protein
MYSIIKTFLYLKSSIGKVIALAVVVVLFNVMNLQASTVMLTNLTWTLTKNARIEGNLLIVNVSKDKANKGGIARTTVDLSSFSGKCYTARIKASLIDVSIPPHDWSGLKFQFHYRPSDNNARRRALLDEFRRKP